jgi:TrmH family RNA methyltransferase
MHISSTDNPKIKGAIKLRERRCRDEESLFLIEGYRELDRAVQGKVEIEALFFAEELFLGSNERTLIQKIEKSGAKIYSCSERVFRKISYRDRPDGLLAIAKKMNMRLDQLSMKKTPLFVIGEAIEKPGNLGTILRTSDAVGADAVIICDRCTDIYNPNVVRRYKRKRFDIFTEASGANSSRRSQCQEPLYRCQLEKINSYCIWHRAARSFRILEKKRNYHRTDPHEGRGRFIKRSHGVYGTFI